MTWKTPEWDREAGSAEWRDWLAAYLKRNGYEGGRRGTVG